jgi:alpha-glucosidase
VIIDSDYDGRMPTAYRFFVVFAALCLSPGEIAGAQSTLDVHIAGASVEIAAATPSAFRLSISFGGKPHPSQSVYLTPSLSAAPSTLINEKGWTGIKTSFGELLVDAADDLWTLRDAQGNTLIPPGPIAQHTINPQSGKPFVLLNVGCASDKRFEVYGCGDGADVLLQDHATPGVGNGHAVVPYYWSRAGYAALAVNADDNAPPAWTVSQALGRLTWVFAGNSADLYLMPAASMADASRAYADLSGPPVVPPRWTFGYLQSRWGWKDRAYIEDAMHQFISRKLPVDAFIFDFEWYATKPDYEVPARGESTFTDFSFNPALFPEPAKQIAAMNASGIHFVGIRKPRLGNSDLLVMARSKNWVLPPGSSGENIDTRCLDFSNPVVRDWYSRQTTQLLKLGIDGWWDDEGEITYSTYFWWNQAEIQALRQVKPDARFWSIDRAFAPGVQRLGATAWTGDIHADWNELQRTPTHLLNWSLAGMPYVACDIGGFSGQTTPRLLTRWMEAGVFFPIMRAHSEFTVQPHFPWLFGPEAEAAIRKALDLRYQLIPLIYTLAHEAHETGLPIMRPLAMEFPYDRRCANRSDEWFLGKDLLAAPILDDTQGRRVYLPAGTWFALGSGTPIEGGRTIDVIAKLDEIPVYVRAGAILTLGPVIQHTDDLPGGPLEVGIYPGKDAKFTLIEDDGATMNYLKGQTRRTDFVWNDAARTLTWKITGPYAGKDIFTDISIAVMDPAGAKHASASIMTDGSQVCAK